MTSTTSTSFTTESHSRPRPVLTQPHLIEAFIELEEIKRQAIALCATLSHQDFNRKPAPKKWSLAQCIEHLNLSGYEMALPTIERLIAESERRQLNPSSSQRNGKVGEWFIKVSGPDSRRRFKTFKRFETSASLEVEETLNRFLQVQDGLVEQLQRADQLNTEELRERNPAMVPLNLEQWFRFTIAHEKRHLEQGRRAIEA